MAANGSGTPRGAGRRLFRNQGWILNALLFLATFLSTTAFGMSVTMSFHAARPLALDGIFAGYVALWHGDPRFWHGLYFSLPLLAILLSHELGHYIACRRNGVDATLPFFLPSPVLLGTMGAFIRIKSPIYSRKELFDIGVSGPVAGFIVLLPFLFVGSAWSRPIHGGIGPDTFSLGLPLAMRAAERLTLGAIPSTCALHPFAVAAWAGLLATAMNLIPMGQLDGGHILYAAAGERWHRWFSFLFLAVLVGLGFMYRAWWFWAVVMFFLGRRHPLVYDRAPIEKARVALAVVAALLFAISIVVVPVSLP